MHQDEFIARRRDDWARLETLLARAGRPNLDLSAAEVRDLSRLYRQATSDLALAQRDFAAEPVATYLNQLVARGHAVIYRAEPLRWRQLVTFYSHTFPAVYRRLGRYTLAAFLLFALPAAATFFVVWHQPAAIYTVLGPGVASTVHTVEQGKLWTDIEPTIRPAAATAILTNNIQVMFLAFAGGILAGLLTVFTMVSNGLQFGSLFGLLQAHQMAAGLGEFVVAHGFIELSVVFLAGGCGLYLADGLLRPGLLSRQQALVEHGRLAVQAILGCVPLLVLAGLIEGFLSPSSAPAAVKLAVGLVTGIALHAYWLARR